MLLARSAALVLIATAAHAAIAQGQPAQVEAVPELEDFDMFDLEVLDDDRIALPGDRAIEVPRTDSPAITTPRVDTTDPCRHLDDRQRRRLTTLCGPSD